MCLYYVNNKTIQCIAMQCNAMQRHAMQCITIMYELVWIHLLPPNIHCIFYILYKIILCTALIPSNITRIHTLVRGLSELSPHPPFYTYHRFFHILGCLGVSKIHVSHVTFGCKESEYLIQDGRQSGYIWPFLGILNKSFILKYNCFSPSQPCLVTYTMSFWCFL